MKFPLRTARKEYLDMRKAQVAESTFNNQQRILSTLVEEIEAGLIAKLSTKNPYKMQLNDVKAFLDYWKDKELENETILRYLQFLNGLLLHCNNHAVEEFKNKNPHLLPKRTKKSINYLSEDELDKVREAAKKVQGWDGAILHFLTAMYPGTGLRPSELRTAELKDLDCRNWTLKVRHPKGEGSYGGRRIVTIMPPFRDDILQYLKEREECLSAKGRDSKYLVPRMQGDDKPYSANHFRVLKRHLEEATGIQFRLKDFRSTFASLTVK
jgi:integrase